MSGTSLPQGAHIVEMVDESPTVRTLTLDLRLDAQPGQFIMAWLPEMDEKPFSLVDDSPVTLAVARVGRFSQAVHDLRIGEQIWVRGPLGQGFTLPECEPESSKSGILLVAGGYGVAPLRFLAERARAAGWTVTGAIGARTADDVILVDRFAALGVRVEVSTDDGSLGQKGTATEVAARLLEQEEYAVLYACGPEAMLDAMEALACEHQLPAQLSYERYMRCAFGVCGSCARQGWLVCRDGPVKHIHHRDTEDTEKKGI